MIIRNRKKYCNLVGCEIRSFWIETAASGEKLIRFNARHDHEAHIITINLAETVVKLMREDSRFAEYFEELKKLV